MRRIRYGVAGLRDPLNMLDHLLNLHGPRYRVDHRRLNHAHGSVRGHTDLDDPDQLHQVRDGRPLPVAVSDDGPWWGSADTFVIPNDAVAVLVYAAPAFAECYRRAGARRHRQGAQRPEAVTNDVDGDGRNPLLRQGGSQCQRIAAPGASSLLAPPGTVAEDRHRPPTRGPGPRRQVQVEEHLVDALYDRRPGLGPDWRDELLR